MSLTAGAATEVSKTDTTAVVTVAAASSGTAPYTYQWYRSTTTGFTPGVGNIIAGATAQTLSDSGLIPNTTYYYKNVVTDSAESPATDTSNQLTLQTTATVLAQNQFAQIPIVGQVDQQFNYNTAEAQIDLTESGTLYPGQAVKIYDSANGIPKVVACSADSDEVFGFINFDHLHATFVAGDRVEISQDGNVLFLMPTANGARGARAVSDISTVGGVAVASGSGGEDIVGYFWDKPVAGVPCRVKVNVPSFLKDA
jgi:hypothetical protein